MSGSLASTCLYYPFIEIPEPVLVHALLFKDHIKKIIPPQYAVRDEERETYNRDNEIIKKILGYEFIIEADYEESRKDIAEDFVSLLTDAHNAHNVAEFSGLFGENYKNRFDVKRHRSIFGVQHFVYADKFDHRVFSTLGRLGWMKHADYHVCELRNELSNVYMTLLAAAISKRTREPILTGIAESESILRDKVFQKYFSRHLPIQLQSNTKDLQELCLTLLLSGNIKEANTKREQLVEQFLSINEAAKIRANLEKSRVDFCKVVDTLVGKVSAISAQNIEQYLTYEAQDVIAAARDYKSKLDEELSRQLLNHKKENRKYVRTGISLAFPVLGKIADMISTGTAASNTWTEVGTALSLFSFLTLERQPSDATKSEPTSRENAYLFLNNLWSLQHRQGN